MNVILLERVAKLGAMGEVVRVRDGYARNFLLPQGKALRAAIKENAARFEKERSNLEVRNAERKSEADQVKVGPRPALLRRDPSGGRDRPASTVGVAARHRRHPVGGRLRGGARPGGTQHADQGDRHPLGRDRPGIRKCWPRSPSTSPAPRTKPDARPVARISPPVPRRDLRARGRLGSRRRGRGERVSLRLRPQRFVAEEGAPRGRLFSCRFLARIGGRH